MPTRCRIDLTEIEARALMSVIGEVLDHDDARERYTDAGVDVAAAGRASDKIARAWREKFHTKQGERP